MTDARSESLWCMSGASNPGMSFSTRKPLISPFRGARPDDGDVGDRAVRDPHLRAVEDPVRAVASGQRAHGPGVGAGVGLGQSEAADLLAGVHRRQPPLLLILGSPLPDREHRERALHRDEAANARVACLELLAHEPVHDRARLGQPVALEVHSEQAESRQLGNQVEGKLAAFEPLADVRLDLLGDELAHGVADRPLLVGEQRVDREEVERVDRARRNALRGHAVMLSRSPRPSDRTSGGMRAASSRRSVVGGMTVRRSRADPGRTREGAYHGRSAC